MNVENWRSGGQDEVSTGAVTTTGNSVSHDKFSTQEPPRKTLLPESTEHMKSQYSDKNPPWMAAYSCKFMGKLPAHWPREATTFFFPLSLFFSETNSFSNALNVSACARLLWFVWMFHVCLCPLWRPRLPLLTALADAERLWGCHSGGARSGTGGALPSPLLSAPCPNLLTFRNNRHSVWGSQR